MKKFPLSSMLLGAFVGVTIPLTLSSPLAYGAEHNHGQHQSQASKTYTCPMHPDVISDKEGRCPICNMFLVAKEEPHKDALKRKTTNNQLVNQQKSALLAKTNSNDNANVKYVCPMHPQVVSDATGSCPICGMNLEKVTVTDASQEITTEVSDPNQHHMSHMKEATSVEKNQTDKVFSQPNPALLPTANQGDSTNVKYVCPMHSQVVSDTPSTCPICGMNLEKVTVNNANQEIAVGASAPIPHHMTNMNEATSVEKNQTDKVFSQPKPALLPTANQGDSTNVKYVCPMHPHVVSDVPGTCPICGMNLEKVTVNDASQEIVVGVSGGMQQALGMRSHIVEKTSLTRQVNTIGTVQYNEDTIGHVHTRATGWIETLTVHNVGQQIKKGQLLYELYSPELVNAQDDYSQAQDYLKQDKNRGRGLLLKARKRLALLGVDSTIIDHLDKTGETLYKVPFYAPQDGVISKLTIRHGMYIQPGDTLFEIVNLDSVWVIADVFENEQTWLNKGAKVTVSAAAQGVFDIDSTVDYIYPELDPVTRAMRVRVELKNVNDKLKPGSLVDVTLFGLPKHNVLTVPTEALILTGRENRVVVQRNDTSFASIPVKIGMMSDGKAEILTGLNEDDKVVVSGQFLLDSEASIQGSLQRLSNNASTSKNTTATDTHQH